MVGKTGKSVGLVSLYIKYFFRQRKFNNSRIILWINEANRFVDCPIQSSVEGRDHIADVYFVQNKKKLNFIISRKVRKKYFLVPVFP